MPEPFVLQAWSLKLGFLIYLQYQLHFGYRALDGEYHNDIIHMQPGLGNPSNAQTKP